MKLSKFEPPKKRTAAQREPTESGAIRSVGANVAT